MDGYREAIGDLLADDLSAFDRGRVELFCTWLGTTGQRWQDADLDVYRRWLLAWGYPVTCAALHVEVIERRIAELQGGT
jgi:hypothetical protein